MSPEENTSACIVTADTVVEGLSSGRGQAPTRTPEPASFTDEGTRKKVLGKSIAHYEGADKNSSRLSLTHATCNPALVSELSQQGSRACRHFPDTRLCASLGPGEAELAWRLMDTRPV